ncbi:MAG: N-6 DNA methylase, partial [Waddliaceae bacterium]
KFVEEHGGGIGDISIYGQESNPTTWRLCKMNLAIRQIEGNIGFKNADTFHNDLHKDLKADYIIANPPFNISDWGGENLREDMRWKLGVPPAGNANFAWVQHIVHHLAPRGVAGFVLANGSMSSNTGGEGEIRKKLIEADLVDCMVALPGQLFYSTQIPVCLWFLAKDRKGSSESNSKMRDRRGEILFIDARKLGYMADRTHRDLDADADIKYIVDTYHSWRGDEVDHESFKNGYQDISGFCKAIKTEEVQEHDFVLTPGRYVGAEEIEDDGISFDEKMKELTQTLAEQMERSNELDEEVKKQLARLGYEF